MIRNKKTTKWSERLKFIQFMKNKAHHSGISCRPYEAMFGCKAKVGLKTFLPSLDILPEMKSEEDLESILKDNQSGNEPETTNNVDTNAGCCSDENTDYVELPSGNTEIHSNALLTEGDQQMPTTSVIDATINVRSQNISKARDTARQSLDKQAKKMLLLSNTKFPQAEVGQSVRIKVPEVDRAKADGRNILAVVIFIEKENLYKLGTKHGILDQFYSRNEFTICKEKFISINEVPENAITLRECARKESNLGGQGFQHCNCTAECNSNRCKCKKLQILCNSKCHKSRSCKNK